MAEYHNQSKLRFWCQMVLPLVYDDSLSYMELLNKVVSYLNNCIQDVGNCETNIESLLEAFVNLQDYLNEIAEDISPLIEEKIDEMIESGELGEILADALASVVSPEYDSSESYVPLNYAIKDGQLYCCTANTTGEWDSTKWRETTVGDELNTLMQKVYSLNAGDVSFDPTKTYASGTVGNKLKNLTANDVKYNSSQTYNNATVGKELSNLNGAINDIDNASVSYALQTQKLPAANAIYEYQADIADTDYDAKIIITNGGSGVYYSYGLYRNGTLVYGNGAVEDPVIWIGGNSTATIEIPDNIVADTLQIRNRNGSANLSVAITKHGTGTKANVTYLDVGTGKTYTSLRTALDYAATIANPKNNVIVRFYGSGDYDVSNDITASDLTADSTFNGLDVPPYTKLLGMGDINNNKISLTLSSSLSSDIIYRISTINLYENAELENVWIYGNNVRYPCHDDFNTPNPNWEKKVIRGCRFTSDSSQQHRAYGAGYRSGMKWEFYDCTFELLEGASVGNPAFSAHNNAPMDKPSYLSFYKCNFQGGYGAGFGSLNRQANNAPSFIYFEGCNTIHVNPSVNYEVAMYAETNTGIETYMYGVGNNFTYSDVYINDHGGSGGTPSGTSYAYRVNLNQRIISKQIDLPTDTNTHVVASIVLNKIGYVTSAALTLAFTGNNVEITVGGDIYNMDVSSVFSAPQVFAMFGYAAERPIMAQYASGRIVVRNMVRSFAANITATVGLSGFYIGS